MLQHKRSVTALSRGNKGRENTLRNLRARVLRRNLRARILRHNLRACILRRMCNSQSYLLSMLLTLLSRPSLPCSKLSVFLSMALLCGACQHPVSALLRSPNILRKIWKLPRHRHTSFLHCTSGLQSFYSDNVVSNRFISLCQRARASGSPLICYIFTESVSVVPPCWCITRILSIFPSQRGTVEGKM